MYNVTDEQVDFILNDIKAHGVILEDLQDNLLDHMCCIIEEELTEGGDFYKFYESILPRFFKRELKEIQEETDNLLTFKHYYAMKKILNISGISSAILTLVGATLKTFHLPGAGIMIVLGGFIFSLLFLPLMIALKFKDEEKKVDKWVLSFGFLIAISASAGTLLKVMHWPGANILMLGGITSFVFVYIPLYFFTRVKRPELRFNTTVNAVLMMACGGLLYAMFNLGFSTNVSGSVHASYQFMNDNTIGLVTVNNNMYKPLTSNETVTKFHKSSSELFNHIEATKVNIIVKVDGISETKAKNMTLSQMEDPNNNILVRQHFDNAKGELSLSSLKQKVDAYNNGVRVIYPNNKEKVIAIEKLQLDRTIAEMVLHQLSQIQLQIATTENSYLNSLSTK